MSSEPVTVPLPERAGLPEAAALGAEIARALEGGQALRIDSTPAQEVALPILQLLVAAHRQAAAQGTTLGVTLPEDGALAGCLAAHALDGAGLLRIEGGIWTGIATTEAAR